MPQTNAGEVLSILGWVLAGASLLLQAPAELANPDILPPRFNMNLAAWGSLALAVLAIGSAIASIVSASSLSKPRPAVVTSACLIVTVSLMGVTVLFVSDWLFLRYG